MPRFTVKDLLIAAALIAAGLAILLSIKWNNFDGLYVLIALGLIGAGLGKPFHKSQLVAYWLTVIGFLVMFAYLMWLIVTDFFW
jgi:hypothetical protein